MKSQPLIASSLVGSLLVLVGALVGGVLGHLACVWLYRHGYYAMVLPGGLAGLGAGAFRSRWVVVHLMCGAWALMLGLTTEWYLRPWIVDGSFGYFLSHVGSLSGVTLLMVGGGALLGFWLPFLRGREREGSQGQR